MNFDNWIYNPEVGLYFEDGMGVGLEWHEVEELYIDPLTGEVQR